MRERVLVYALVLASLLAVTSQFTSWRALDEASDLRRDNIRAAYIGARTAVFDQFQGCRRANAEVRPGLRITNAVLLRLLVNVNTRNPDAPVEFRDAVGDLKRATKFLEDLPCRTLHPVGFRVWLDRGKPPYR